MQKTVTYCDICGEADAKDFSFAVDSQLDGAGDTDTIHKQVDLCFDCCAAQLQFFIESLLWPDRQKLANRILKDRKLYLDDMTRAQRTHGL